MSEWKKAVLDKVAATMKAATVKSVWPAVKLCGMCGDPYHSDWVLPDRTVEYCAAWKKLL